MDWQKLISFITVLVTLFLIVRSEIKKYKLRKTRPCGSDCNCAVLKEVSLKKLK